MNLEFGPGLRAMRVPVLLLVLVLAGNVATLAGLTLPAWRASAAVGQASRVGQQAHAALEPQLDRARRVYGRVTRAETSVDSLRRRVGERSGGVADVVSTLRAAVDAAGIRADRITYETAPVGELGLTRLQINLPVRGDYRDLRRFLDELLDGPMFVVLQRVSASAPSQNDGSGELQLGLTASVFLDPGPAADDAAADPAATAGAGTALAAPAVEAGGTGRSDSARQVDALADRLRGLPAIPLPDHAFALDLSALDAAMPEVPATRRDLFSFAASRPRPVAEVEPVAVEDLSVPEPVMPYDLIGVNRTAAGFLATLVDGDLVLVVREGQVLPDGYRVASVTAMSVTLEAGDVVRTIPLRPGGGD